MNTNGSFLAERLTEIGFLVTEHVVVDDDTARIVDAVQRLCSRHAVVLTTGGLGPTTDDLTTEAIARAMGVSRVRDPGSLDHLARRLERLGRTLLESNAKQADFPEGATILPNPCGTAPGFSVRHGEAELFAMPGVPSEMMQMFEEQVVPRIRGRAPNDTFQIRLRTFGLPESVVGDRLAGIEAAHPGIIIGYRAHFPQIEVKVLARAETHGQARALCERVTAEVRTRLGDVVFGEGDETLAGVVGRVLRARGAKLAIAESCTGGLVGQMLTREPGASDFLLLDAVVYANQAKSRVLGVSEELLRAHGAVSDEVAVAMAEGARRIVGADLALAITGVAGPGGGTESKPVGTVHFALVGPSGARSATKHFPGDRKWVQTLAAYTGLKMLRDAAEALERRSVHVLDTL